MKVLRSLVLPAVVSLVIFAGCNPENPVLPDPKYAEGYCQDGWRAYAAHDFAQALECFQAAIDVDVTYSEAYLGAGWASLNVSDYWVRADDYFYMALQQDMGYAPITFTSGSLTQDTMWTVFECLDPALPPEVLDPILEQTASQGAAWVGDQIFPLVYNADDRNPNIPYRFHVDAANVVAMITTFNNTSSFNSPIDSIVPDGEGDYWVHVTGTYKRVTVGDLQIRTWISVDNEMTFDYATFRPGEMTQVSYDALAGWVMLQHARGTNGDPLTANAACWALDRSLDNYVFGEGAFRRNNVDLGSGIENLNLVQIKGMAAASSFNAKWPRIALFDCRSEGYAEGLDAANPDFLLLLIQEIEEMIAFQG
ncbi:MAG TPA: hypothetical protein PLX54_04025 [Candidatus Fermentibacter daniensis]|jgi:hypothetical protein|nr:MAG: hypothetical protein AO395_07300 [Candidatus Fermentibacter daniensis]MBP7719040.1 hypothetical protein [Candidatus Fermentibacter sp.]OQC70421.1 MAG: hypothetical protein BWX47_00422 [candidate division Hyd24-12 bacterium ADurb.Bin004]KZD17620.1 MAG: hypothetical protein AO396_02935 [Candidatus Fermentibacter daniensis]MCC6871959.1 hypothetical protein [Candidatus Fermentibacter sp.]